MVDIDIKSYYSQVDEEDLWVSWSISSWSEEVIKFSVEVQNDITIT